MEGNLERAKVHMLPTEDKSEISCGNTGTGLIHHTTLKPNYTKRTYQHLYITILREIKGGTPVWYIDEFLNKPYHSGGAGYGSKQQVIIATTDPNIHEVVATDGIGNPVSSAPLPQPPQAFIRAYCLSCIDEVDVEYEYNEEWDTIEGISKYANDEKYFLKVDPIHNTITTHRIVDDELNRFIKYVEKENGFIPHEIKEWSDKWIEKKIKN